MLEGPNILNTLYIVTISILKDNQQETKIICLNLILWVGSSETIREIV